MRIAPFDRRNQSVFPVQDLDRQRSESADPYASHHSQAETCGNQLWYVFRALVRQEGLAEANLSAQGFTHFLPKVLVTKRHARRFVAKREWLFPRYGFVAFDVSRDRWRSVNGTLGVERLVMGNDGPQPVPMGIVEALQASIDERGLFEPNAGLQPGDIVRVKSGIFAGSLGELQSLDAKGRIELLLQWMNGQVRVKLARDWVETAA
jgi:transcriptional antiterminator RfaH